MAFKKTNYRRKRYVKRKGLKSTKKLINTVAKQVVLKNTDQKWQMTGVNGNPLPSGSLVPLGVNSNPTDITTTALAGQPDSARVGSKLRIKKHCLDFRINTPTGLPIQNVRLLLVRFPRNAMQDIVPSDILQFSTTPDALFSRYQSDSPYQVLYDRVYPAGIQNVIGPSVHRITLDWSKHPKSVKYSDVSPGTGAFGDIMSGHMAWYFASDSATLTIDYLATTYFYET